ncbi:class I SAM-dependent methyltransferase [Mycobacterium noviomagense]|uniref:class I SAM-dependent methyltransferase n=1 Tax=Mycobacterium noviomagense TaxID=459858 RepID=UPI0009F63505|nr:class I SAM-dependent methyltransferase [Mycobacterium noviomagense]
MQATSLPRPARWLFRSIELAARFEPIRRVLFDYYDKRLMRLAPVHPFDNQYGVRTSGALPGSVLRLGYSLKDTTAYVGYLGVQPSIVRRALNILPLHNDATFLDLGCGKGRALVVASEFPFREVVGVEITPELAKVAQENARVIAQNWPQRPPITVVNGDALDYELPGGKLVIFLYNPFGEDLVTKLLARIESALRTGPSNIWVVYINPVWGNIFDSSPTLSRIYAESIPYDPAEIGFGPDSSDLVVIWQDAKSTPVTDSESVDRQIVMTNFGLRAELAD